MDLQRYATICLCPFCDDWLLHLKFSRVIALRCPRCAIAIPATHIFLIPQQNALLAEVLKGMVHDKINPTKKS